MKCKGVDFLVWKTRHLIRCDTNYSFLYFMITGDKSVVNSPRTLCTNRICSPTLTKVFYFLPPLLYIIFISRSSSRLWKILAFKYARKRLTLATIMSLLVPRRETRGTTAPDGAFPAHLKLTEFLIIIIIIAESVYILLIVSLNLTTFKFK